ncbi:hypothetical protein RF11_13105 [Thelohanellus kitauei]|uniref:Uncharacterized protein n=1 Tax=Thelohanellus kitauei TaxID=669202 RepID=A0A0C2MN61_THEKT|nr:hypothetical protein RF11_13105 [Thelohanellus kitauei]
MAHLKGVVLGVFSDGKGSFELTPAAKEFDTKLQGKLTTSLKALEYPFIVVTGLGDSTAGYCPIEEIDLKLENIRVAIHGGFYFIISNTNRYTSILAQDKGV